MTREILPAFYTVPEVARILRIARNQAYEKCATGEIPSIRIGERTIRVPRREFEEKFGLMTR